MKDKLVILAVEDDRNDLEMLKYAVAGIGEPVELQMARDGNEAIAYLQGEREFGDRILHPCPDLIMMDLKMPRMGGLEVLGWLKDHPELATIPKIILSGSDIERDVCDAYRLGVNTFFTKPTGFAPLQDLMRYIVGYWRRSQVGVGVHAVPL